PTGVALDANGNILVIDPHVGTNGLGALIMVNPSTSLRTMVNDFGDPAQGPLGVKTSRASWWVGREMLVTDTDAGTGNHGALFIVQSGTRTLLSDFGNAAQGPLGQDPSGVALDANGNILVTDPNNGTGGKGELFRVDRNTGARTILSDFGNAAQGPLGE